MNIANGVEQLVPDVLTRMVIEDLIEAGLVDKLVELLKLDDDPALQRESASVVAKIAIRFSEELIESDVIPTLIRVLYVSPNEDVREQAVSVPCLTSLLLLLLLRRFIWIGVLLILQRLQIDFDTLHQKTYLYVWLSTHDTWSFAACFHPSTKHTIQLWKGS